MSWQRRIIPAGYATGTLRMNGTSPLLMSNGEFDRDGELFRAYFLLGKKQRKSLDDEARLRELEWQLRIYLDDDLGPFIPGKNIKEMLRSAATKWRKGEDVKRSLVIVPFRIPLVYEGPRDQAGLWDAGFRFTAMVSNAGPGSGRVARCRPMFRNWSLDVEVAWDPEDLDADFLALVVERSQKYGLGDYRPEFGSFTAALYDAKDHKVPVNGNAKKARDPDQEQAHAAFVDRIVVTA